MYGISGKRTKLRARALQWTRKHAPINAEPTHASDWKLCVSVCGCGPSVGCAISARWLAGCVRKGRMWCVACSCVQTTGGVLHGPDIAIDADAGCALLHFRCWHDRVLGKLGVPEHDDENHLKITCIRLPLVFFQYTYMHIYIYNTGMYRGCLCALCGICVVDV